MLDPARLRAAYEQAKGELLAERTPDGHWVGELSSSALSTATAVSALAVVRNSGQVECRTSHVERRLAVAKDQSFDFRLSTFDNLIARGVQYLLTQQNDDGGFGDTDLSHSNIATTMLVVAALHLAGVAHEHAGVLARANAYIDRNGRLAGLRERYGIDKTFVVPIMTNCALAGLIDWREIDPLPFELACVPQSWYRFVGMPVVSYAIPALVAIGQARYHYAPPRNPVTRLVRWLSINRSLKVLRRMQPDSGGYLEATPLTSFVVMSLASIHRSPHAPREELISKSEMPTVIRDGVKFLANSIRPDGSWPIDTNLATWNTTLAINALAGAGEDVASILEVDDEAVRHATDVFMSGAPEQVEGANRGNVLLWLLSCQHLKRHPFTGASAGGFGWSDLTGAVPDADDTPGAILAFGALVKLDMRVGTIRNLIGNSIAFYAMGWLLSLQNRDGGWPTFCRGWGRLPFDRSGTDLTAHALRAIVVTGKQFKLTGDDHAVKWIDGVRNRVESRALAFVARHQHPDGSWSPLWFGNQDHPNEDNPVYGTAKVLMAYRDLGLMELPEAKRGVAWLVANQNADGGWGSGVWGKRRRTKDEGRNEAERPRDSGVRSLGEPVPSTQYSVPSTDGIPNPKSKIQNLKSSVEETALAVEALLAACPRNATEGVPYTPEPRTLNPEPVTAAARKGLNWLIERVERGEHRQPAPIGFYFAKLWYYERLYPLTFTVAALGRALRALTRPIESGTDRQTQSAGSP